MDHKTTRKDLQDVQRRRRLPHRSEPYWLDLHIRQFESLPDWQRPRALFGYRTDNRNYVARIRFPNGNCENAPPMCDDDVAGASSQKGGPLNFAYVGSFERAEQKAMEWCAKRFERWQREDLGVKLQP